jgi:hypothetical protein
MRCEAVYDGISENCAADAKRVAIRGEIATVFGNLCEYHQHEVMMEGKTVLECPVEGVEPPVERSASCQ